MGPDLVLMGGVFLIVLALYKVADNAGDWKDTYIFAGVCGICLVALSQYGPASVNNVNSDNVSMAFDQYEREWRDNAQMAADAIESGEFDTPVAVRAFLSAENIAARRRAFEDIARAEAAGLADWSAAAHVAILRSYAQ